MTSKRKTGGRHEFVDSDSLAHLDDKLGKHAKIGGRKLYREKQYKYGLWQPEYEHKNGLEFEPSEKKPSFWRRLKKLFGK